MKFIFKIIAVLALILGIYLLYQKDSVQNILRQYLPEYSKSSAKTENNHEPQQEKENIVQNQESHAAIENHQQEEHNPHASIIEKEKKELLFYKLWYQTTIKFLLDENYKDEMLMLKASYIPHDLETMLQNMSIKNKHIVPRPFSYVIQINKADSYSK